MRAVMGWLAKNSSVTIMALLPPRLFISSPVSTTEPSPNTFLLGTK